MIVKTAEQATRAVGAARDRLAYAVTHDTRPQDLADLLNELAAAEGVAFALTRLEMARAAEGDQGVIEEAARLLGEGADDKWSGRTNDVRRARYDGLRRVAASAVTEASWNRSKA